MAAILECRNLSHRFSDGTHALRQVDLSVEKGEYLVLAGRNGSGKTTLLRHFNGLLTPSAGTVQVNGLALCRRNLTAIRKMVGMVFQDADAQIVGETVFEDAAFGPRNLKRSPEEIDAAVGRALEEAGLSDLAEARPHTLSGGEKRRLAIAGVLAMEPEIIVFDEPFSNLDYPGATTLIRRLSALKSSGRTIILATHDLEKIAYEADRIVFMASGRIALSGPPSEVLARSEEFGVRMPCAVRMGLKMQPWPG